jgi:hypothetical protein
MSNGPQLAWGRILLRRRECKPLSESWKPGRELGRREFGGGSDRPSRKIEAWSGKSEIGF